MTSQYFYVTSLVFAAGKPTSKLCYNNKEKVYDGSRSKVM